MRQELSVTIMPRPRAVQSCANGHRSLSCHAPEPLGETLVTITVPKHVANCAKKVLIDSILQTKIPACRWQSVACH
jgi:hypothetical protein